MSYRLCFNYKMFQLKFTVSVLTLVLCHSTPTVGPHDTDNSCVLRLYEASGNIAPSSCITYNDIEAAFFRAKRKVGLRRPAIVKDEQAVAHLGLALQETTRILAQRFYLNVNQTDILLTSVDTSRTEIGKYCAHALRGKERCQEEGYRRHDATCNNLENPSWGASGLPFKRLLLPEYADRISEPKVSKNGYPLPLARLVSTTIHGHKPIRHQHLITFMFASWGQLVDHDLTLTAETKDPVTRKDVNCCGNSDRHPNCLPIEIPENDPFYSKNPYRKRCIHFARSLNGVRYGCKLGSRVQTNRLTSYIDASFMYGSNMRVADSLRTLQGGLMKMYPAFDDKKMKPLLPLKTVQPDDGCFRANGDDFCFLAGDNRVNEQLGLGVLHTLVVREHNRIAKELSRINPKWDDEIIYQETRNIMAAVVQHITYNEFLPQLLGEEVITKYNLSLQTRLGRNGFSYDYNPKIDATIPYAFAMAAYRFGHSLLPDKMEKRSSSHHLIGERNLREILQQPYDLYIPGSMDAYTLGMINQLSQGMDSAITQEVTNHLFEEPSKLSGRDLAATNIQRGREHGLPGYLAYRRWCKLETVSSWGEMWKLLPNSTVNLYSSVYRYPEDIDLWSAGVSEDPAPGSLIGPLFTCIIAATFKNLKLGDRFWYENGGFRNSFTRAQLNEIRKYTLARLLCNTGDNIQTVQRLAMLMPDHHKNQRVSCRSKEIPDINLHFWKEIESSDNYYTRPTLLPPIIDNIVTLSTQPPDLFTKPPGFDQVVYNLVNQQPLNLSSSSLHNYYSFADNTSNIFLIKL